MRTSQLIATLGLAGFISAADNWFVSPVLPAIASDLQVAIPVAGMILTAYLIPYGCMQPVFGIISDRIGKIRILQIILAGFALGSVACALSATLPDLMIWRGCTGFFAAGIIAVSLAHIGDTIPESKRQHYVGIFMGIVFLGQGLSVGIGGFLAECFSWRVAFFLFSLMAILTLLLLLQTPKGHVIRSPFSLREEGHIIWQDKRSWIYFPLAGAVGFFLIGIYSYLGAFMHQICGLNSLKSGLVIMFFGFSALIGGMKAGYIRRACGYRLMIAGGAGVALASIVLLAVAPSWETGIIASTGLGLGYISIQSSIATLVFAISPDSKGLPSALVGLGLFGGAGLGTALMGYLIPAAGYTSSMLIFCIGICGILLAATTVSGDE